MAEQHLSDNDNLKDHLLFLSNLPSTILDDQDAQMKWNCAVQEIKAMPLVESQDSGDKAIMEYALGPMKEVIRGLADGSIIKAVLKVMLQCILEGQPDAQIEGFSEILSNIVDSAKQVLQAIGESPENHEKKADKLHGLAIQLWRKYIEYPKNQEDLQNVILFLQEALKLNPLENVDKAKRIDDLGRALRAQFEYFSSDINDINTAVDFQKQAVDLIPSGDPQKPGMLSSLATTLFTRFQYHGEASDNEHAIQMFQQVLDITSQSDPVRGNVINNLAAAFQMNFEQSGDESDLSKSISLLQQGVAVTEHLGQKRKMLNTLGVALHSRFDHFCNEDDMRNAILYLEQALDLTPANNLARPSMLANLGSALQEWFEYTLESSNIDNAIHYLSQAVELAPDSHANKVLIFTNLGCAFSSRFQYFGQNKDHENAIVYLQRALDFDSDGYLTKSERLINLAYAAFAEFVSSGNKESIDQAILMQRQALDSAEDDLHKVDALVCLGIALKKKFEHFYSIDDIETAILTLQQAVDLTPESHALKAARLIVLGKALQLRFQWLDDPSDIDRAVCVQSQALDLIPNSHPNRVYQLITLADFFKLKFEQLGFHDAEDIKKAVQILEDAIDVTPEGHIQKAFWSSNLGDAICTLFDQVSHDNNDIEKAISILHKAFDYVYTDQNKDEIAAMYSNLGRAYQIRFDNFCSKNMLADINIALSAFQDAVDLTSEDNSRKANRLIDLAYAFKCRFDILNEAIDLEKASAAYQEVIHLPVSIPHVSFQAAERWAEMCTRADDYAQALEAYKHFFRLLPQVAGFGQIIQHRYEKIHSISKINSNVLNQAVKTAIVTQNLSLAVEWLEEGHSIIWRQILQLHAPVDLLYSEHPDIAKSLELVSQALLDAGKASQNQSLNAMPLSQMESSYHKLLTYYGKMQNHRKLAEKYENILEKVRILPGFEN
ncbi:hypothetical protein VKT23_006059 [Stygiomarasmius scandens]|uniref:Uncharacterized protein n=1 Tax=Marasmiellus scandens TaxID=2682957 RepID=A0ABR1JR78_9AGAR